MRYLIYFSYDGTKFHGFQRQKDVKNVQGLLEKTLSNYFNEEIVIKGSGRTDNGVHAINQAAHFDINREVQKKEIKVINKLLDDEIHINKIKMVNNDFHARYSVKYKTYIYKIIIGRINNNEKGYYYQVSNNIDIKKMKSASKLFIGTHDFRNFVSGIRDDYVTTIYKIKFLRFKNKIYIKFVGKGFYRYMVRNLVGALIDIGKNKIDESIILNMLDTEETTKKLSVVTPYGLYLKNVKY